MSPFGYICGGLVLYAVIVFAWFAWEMHHAPLDPSERPAPPADSAK